MFGNKTKDIIPNEETFFENMQVNIVYCIHIVIFFVTLLVEVEPTYFWRSVYVP